MFRIFSVAVYDFVEKRTKNRKWLNFNYFLAMGLIFAAFLTVVGCLTSIRDLVAGELDSQVFAKMMAAFPLFGFVLGDLFGLIPWLMWFRHGPEALEGK